MKEKKNAKYKETFISTENFSYFTSFFYIQSIEVLITLLLF